MQLIWSASGLAYRLHPITDTAIVMRVGPMPIPLDFLFQFLACVLYLEDSFLGYRISKMREAGLVDRLSQKYWPPNICAATSQTAYAMLDFSAVSGAYGACAVVSVAAVLTFIVERRCRHLLVKSNTHEGDNSDVIREPGGVSSERFTTRL